MIAFQTGQEIDIFNLLIDICPPLAILLVIGGVVFGIVKLMRSGD